MGSSCLSNVISGTLETPRSSGAINTRQNSAVVHADYATNSNLISSPNPDINATLLEIPLDPIVLAGLASA
jgi:hypothetical protein